ncbi:MAG: glycosyltransferase [Aeromicrobium sp.]
MAEISLPPGNHYALMWGIPDNYAGMTNAMLHRSKAFVELAKTDVTIVTYEFREDYDDIRQKLRERGALIDGLSVINLWEDLRGWDDEQLAAAAAFYTEGPDATFEPLEKRGDHAHPLRNVLLNFDEKIDQIDYFREDGTLFVSDRRMVPGDKKRSLTLCDRKGQPLGTWRNVWDFYYFWLDSLPRDPIAWFIADSKTSSNHLVSYRRDDVVTLHVVHGSHLAPGSTDDVTEITASRRHVFDRLDKWDAVIFLTQHQLDDVEKLLGPGTNRYVCPNGRMVPESPPRLDRPSNRGVMLASLSKRKQIDHAIVAMSRVGRVGLRRPVLDVYGRGPQKKPLSKHILEQKPRPQVNLRGYLPDAVHQFADASFSLLTSNNEAFGLVLVESMGMGCIPISYDMPYGPAEIITHGVDGFIVPADDIDALAAIIKEVAKMSPAALAPIRVAAYKRAQDFNDEHVTEHWSTIMRSALESKIESL